MIVEQRGFLYCTLVALAAALIGCVVATVIYLAIDLGRMRPDGMQLNDIPAALLIVMLAALIVTVPVSFTIGAPLLWIGQRVVIRWPFVGAVLFAVTGVIAAIPINAWINGGGLQNPERDLPTSMLFGGVIAGLHVLLFQITRRRWLGTMFLGFATAAVGGLLGVLILDEHRNRLAASAMASCPDYDFASHRLAPAQIAAIGQTGHHLSYEQGHWGLLWERPGLFGRYSALFVDGQRTLVAEDRALVPIRPWHRLGLGLPPPATAQCLLTLANPEAALLRNVGLVRQFRWADVDPLFR